MKHYYQIISSLLIAAAMTGATAGAQTSMPITLPQSVPNGTFTASRGGTMLATGDIVSLGDVIDFTATPNEGCYQTGGTVTGSHTIVETDFPGSHDLLQAVDATGWTAVSESNTYENGVRTSGGYKVVLPRFKNDDHTVTYSSTATGTYTLSWEWAVNQGYINYGEFSLTLYLNDVAVASEVFDSSNINAYSNVRAVSYSFQATGNDTFRWVAKRLTNGSWGDDGRTAYIGNIVLTNDNAGFTPAPPVFSPRYNVTTSVVGEGTVTTSVEQALPGDNVTFTATPAKGYYLHSVAVTCGEDTVNTTLNNGVYSFVMPEGDVTACVQFAARVQTIALPASVEHGTFVAICGGEQLSNGDSLNLGDVVMFISTPDEGYYQASGTQTGAVTIGESLFVQQPDETFLYTPAVPVFKKYYNVNLVSGDNYTLSTNNSKPESGISIDITINGLNGAAGDKIFPVTQDGDTLSAPYVPKDNVYRFTMPECDVTVSAAVIEAPQQVDGYYQIGTAQELYWLAKAVTTGTSNINAELTADIDYTKYDMVIGYCYSLTENRPYSGDFNGNYHTITYNFSTKRSYYGLFPAIANGAKVRNLRVAGSMSASHDYTGGIVGVILSNDGATVENCVSDVNFHCYGSTLNDNGGVVAWAYRSSRIKNCLWTGKATGSGRIGGIIGAGASYDNYVENCLSTGSAQGISLYGVVGRQNGVDARIRNCYAVGVSHSQGTEVTMDQVKSGEVAWLLNGGNAIDPAWFQTLTGDNAQDTPMPWGKDAVVLLENDGNDTFYGGTNNSFVPTTTGVKPHIVTVATTSKVGVRAVDDIPAGTPVVLMADSTGYYNLTIVDEATAAVDENLLQAATQDVTTDGTTIYAMSKNNDLAGFALLDSDATLAAGRAYLALADEGESFREIVSDDVITAVTDLTVTPATDAPAYNVMGQRVDSSYRGIVIVNGKKQIRR